MLAVMPMLAVLPTENPLLPPAYDWLWTGFITLVTALMLAALFDVMRTATFLRAVEWVAMIVLIPVAGSAIWFAYGRRRFLE